MIEERPDGRVQCITCASVSILQDAARHEKREVAVRDRHERAQRPHPLQRRQIIAHEAEHQGSTEGIGCAVGVSQADGLVAGEVSFLTSVARESNEVSQDVSLYLHQAR